MSIVNIDCLLLITNNNQPSSKIVPHYNMLNDFLYMYSETTRAIEVVVEPYYSYDQSIEEEHFYVWNYNIKIKNIGDRTVQLQARNWILIDDNGQVKKVHGEGVVGKTPTLSPGEDFEYSSYADLNRNSGVMIGTYQMKDLDTNEDFLINIPAFSLDMPHRQVLFS